MSKYKSKRHSNSADRGGYGFDNGLIAFGNPMDLIGKAAKQRKNQREDFQTNKEARNSNRDYHRKHG
jgi:hypothetical protein